MLIGKTMKNSILLMLAVVLVGCSTPSAGPTPTGPDAAVSTAVVPALSSQTATDDRRIIAETPSKPFVPKVDTRTPNQVADAACRGAGGIWYCGDRKAPLMASGNASAGQCGPACTVPNWYLDFANSSGCASDVNSGTSATCAGAGIGPLLHVSQLYARWGSHSPFLVSSTNVTTITIMSSQPIGSATADPWGSFMPVAPDGMVNVTGTLTAVGATCTDGAVTAISRANPGNDWKIAAGTCTYVQGQIAYNSTVAGGSYAWIDSVSVGTATLTPPIAAAGLTTPTNNPSFTTDGASWTGAGGDTIQLYTAPTIYADVFSPQTGSLSAFGGSATSGTVWIQGINFGDASGGVSNSEITMAPIGRAILSLVRADAGLNYVGPSTNGPSFAQHTIAQSWLNGAIDISIGGDTKVYSGSIGANAGTNSASFAGGFVLLEDDVIVHGGWTIFSGNLSLYNAHLNGGSLLVEPGASATMRAGIANGSLWGSGTLQPYQFGTAVNRTGGSWLNNVIVNSLLLTSDSTATGCTPPVNSTYTQNGTTQVNVTGASPAAGALGGTAFPAGAAISFSLSSAGGTPCLFAPYFSQATAANNFYTKNGTVSCNDIMNWAAAPTCGISLTSANIDTYGALYDVQSGARFTN